MTSELVFPALSEFSILRGDFLKSYKGVDMTRVELDAKTSKIYADNMAFFAFSQKQYEEQADPNKDYTRCLSGLFCPTENAKKMMDELEAAIDEFHKADLEANGKEKIIWRELANHEAQISCDLTSTISALEGYGITEEEVREQWGPYLQHCIENDYF